MNHLLRTNKKNSVKQLIQVDDFGIEQESSFLNSIDI